MKLMDQLHLLGRLDQLIRLKATGTPRQLAKRLGVSERQTFRLIGELKGYGFPIEYCKTAKSYYYTGVVQIRFELLIEEFTCLSIKGGKKMEDFFQTAKKWQW